MYTVKGLREGITNCKRNIQTLEEAISKEKNTIKDYRHMIKSIEKAEKDKAEAEANVNIEVVNDITH